MLEAWEWGVDLSENNKTSYFIFGNNRTLCLENCLFVPDFKKNLVFVSCLVEHGLTLQFNSLVSIKSRFSFFCFNDLINLYFLNPFVL